MEACVPDAGRNEDLAGIEVFIRLILIIEVTWSFHELAYTSNVVACDKRRTV